MEGLLVGRGCCGSIGEIVLSDGLSTEAYGFEGTKGRCGFCSG